MGETLLFFFAFFTVWLELAQGNTRFANIKGIVDDILYVTYLIGILVMAMQMDSEQFLLENKVGFMVGILICFAAICLLHVQYHQVIPRAKHYAERRIATYTIACVILGIALLVCEVSDATEKFKTWFSVFCIIIACCVVLGVALISFRVDPRYYDFTMEYFSERFGILIMIVTGEAILALMLGDKSNSYQYYTSEVDGSVVNVYYTNHLGYYIYENSGGFLQYGGQSNFEDYIAVGVSFLTMYVIKNIYFESVAEEHEHALREEGHPGAVVWVLSHLPLAASLLGAGVGYKLMFTTIHDSTSPPAYSYFLGISLCLAIICMLVIRAAHDKFIFPIQSMLIRIPTAIAIPLGVMFLENSLDYMYWCCGFVVLSWIWDLTIMEHLEVKKPHEDEDHHGHHDHHHHHSSGVCSSIAQTCGFVDKEYAGAYHGPHNEGDPRQLLVDFFCCKICNEPAPIPAEFDPEYVHELQTKHEHHGHGHEEHVDESEAGSDHGWFGEFTDLIFVAIVYKFADQMKYKQTTLNQADDQLIETDWEKVRIYLEAALIYVVFFVLWLELTHLLIRFRNMPGIFDDLMHFFYLFGVVAMGIQMNHLEYFLDRRMAFCGWFAFCMFVLVILHLKFYQIDAAEEYCRLRMITFTCTGILAGIGGALSEVSCTILLLLGCIISLFVSLNSFRVWADTVPNQHINDEYVERFGLIVMITTGESILALVLADFDQLEFEEYYTVIIAFLTMYVVKLIYFNSHSEEPECHALAEGNVPGAVLWALMHLPASFCLMTSGLGYKMILPYVHDDKVDDISRWTLGFSIAGVLVSFMVIRAAHNKFTLPLASVFIRLPTIALAPAAGFYIEGPVAYVTWCCCICIVNYSLDALLIDQLQFELDFDFMETLQASKQKKGEKMALLQKSSSHQEIEMTQHHGHHGHHEGTHGTGHHGGHDSGHHGSHHSGHHEIHHSGHHETHHSGHHGSHHSGHHGSHHDANHGKHHEHHKHHGGNHGDHQDGNHGDHHDGNHGDHHDGNHRGHHDGNHGGHHSGDHGGHHNGHHAANHGKHHEHRRHHNKHHGGHHQDHNKHHGAADGGHNGHHQDHNKHHGGHHEHHQDHHKHHEGPGHHGGHPEHHGSPHSADHGAHHGGHHGAHPEAHHGAHPEAHHGAHPEAHHGGHHSGNHGSHNDANHGKHHEDHHKPHHEHHKPHSSGHHDEHSDDSDEHDGQRGHSYHGPDHRQHHAHHQGRRAQSHQPDPYRGYGHGPVHPYHGGFLPGYGYPPPQHSYFPPHHSQKRFAGH